jgi:hypothetical protein
MSTYTPDAWVILEINSVEHGKCRKILAGWFGGYLSGDSWKLSSGNLPEHIEDGYIIFPQESGSVYCCHINSERLSNITASQLAYWRKNLPEGASINLIKYANY